MAKIKSKVKKGLIMQPKIDEKQKNRDTHSLHLTHLTEQNDKSRKLGVGFHQGTTSQKNKNDRLDDI